MNQYITHIVGAEHALFPNYLHCGHDCDYVIQLLNPDNRNVEFEFCPLLAEQFAGQLLEAIELCHLSK